MYNLRKQNWQKYMDIIILDLVGLTISFFAACFIRQGNITYFWGALNRSVLLAALMISLIISVFLESFKSVLKEDILEKGFDAFKHSLLVFLLIACYLYSTQKAESYSRIVFYLTFLFYCLSGWLVRNIWSYFLKKAGKSRGKCSLLMVTLKDSLEDHVSDLQDNYYKVFQISGIAILDADMKGQVVGDIPIVAGREDLFHYVLRQWIDEVFLDLPQKDSDLCQELVENFNKMGVVTHVRLTDESEQPGKKQFVEEMGNYVVLTTSMNYVTLSQLFIKRTMDIVGSVIGLIITGVLYLILAPIIKIQSPGPVFFSQVRIGKNGKRFKLYKFRTMYLDAEERKKDLMKSNQMKDDRMFKLSFDPRVIGNKQLSDGTQKTGIMHLCRRLSLDEFPQFFNVLKGEMSLVGTRPPTVEEYETYEFHHHARLACKPGITGMWQVNGRSNITDFEEVVKLDMKYINEWNLGLDLKILMKTIVMVIKKEGSM